MKTSFHNVTEHEVETCLFVSGLFCLSTMSSSSIRLAANGRISYLPLAENMSICIKVISSTSVQLLNVETKRDGRGGWLGKWSSF